jgi:para-aminobenzoate synthetase component 1
LQRNIKAYNISPEDTGNLKAIMLNWSQQFGVLAFLDSNNYTSAYSRYECLLAVGAATMIANHGTDPLIQLQEAHNLHPDWMFGHICYDYKNILEPKLSSIHPTVHEYPQLQFFVPETVVYINSAKDTLTIETLADADAVYYALMQANEDKLGTTPLPKLTFTPTTTQQDYTNTINKLRQHILDGDCYEINYCTGGSCTNVAIDAASVFDALNKLSPTPFAAYYRLHHQYMMCASPERYLRKEGNHLLSQPIKGTARRSKDLLKDENLKNELQHNIKERAENVMIVDLTRNDLARCCVPGTVTVDELFGIYTFPQVHQMISTVSGKMHPNAPFTDAIRTTFPMGSMTGAPKYKVMQLIDEYEHSNRELFSGTMGYITPSGDFDFNVIIRSLFYNSHTRLLTYETGGAITYDSVAESEWEERLLKAWALEQIFAG